MGIVEADYYINKYTYVLAGIKLKLWIVEIYLLMKKWYT